MSQAIMDGRALYSCYNRRENRKIEEANIVVAIDWQIECTVQMQ